MYKNDENCRTKGLDDTNMEIKNVTENKKWYIFILTSDMVCKIDRTADLRNKI